MSGETTPGEPQVDIERLLESFYGEPSGHSQLAEFEPVDQLPAPYDQLLDHDKHMTVTVEAHYSEKVGVHVHRVARKEDWYAREITLVTGNSRRIVQYGIVRLDFTKLEPEVWKQIESQQIPLGRVLIEHNVLREVQLCGLWKVKAGPSLASLLHLRIGDELFGRTALIYCDGRPAIELLEVVSPATNSS